MEAFLQHPDRDMPRLAVVMSVIHGIEGGLEVESDDRLERQTADADVPFIFFRIEGQDPL